MMTRFMYYEGGTMSYEPPLEDDIALGKDIEEEDDGYQEPEKEKEYE